MTPEEYLQQTEKAVQQLFKSLNHYKDMLKDAIGPVFVISFSNEQDYKEQFEQWVKDNENKIELARQKSREYFGSHVSEAVVCGAILQVAFTGINAFSNNTNIPNNCSAFLKSRSKAVKFCIGRTLWDLPLGLIIYAGRNQHSHADENELNPINKAIFNHLAQYKGKGKYMDPAFLKPDPLTSLAHNVLSMIEWNDYDSYIKDMRVMLNIT